MSNFFCQTCTALLSFTSLPLEDFNPVGVQLLTTSSHSFEDSAREGCRLCLLFVSVFGETKMGELRRREFENQTLPEYEKFETTFTLYSYSSSHSLLEVSHKIKGQQGLKRPRKSVIRPRHSGIMFLSPDSRRPEPPIFAFKLSGRSTKVEGAKPIPRRGENTGSENPLHLAKLWLRECKDHHPACQIGSFGDGSAFAVPTRLLHVGSSSSPSLRLCMSVQNGTAYASLSHCWGQHVPVKLLSSNLAIFQDRIEIVELPKTFRDAIEAVRHLDIQYIWIDSLCIIQDSKEDWAQEAALMHQVYSNAMLNIAADDAKDGTEGLFRDRDSRLCEPCEVEVEWTKQHRGAYLAVDNALWQSSMETSVLNSRAWVLQEQLLSPRILHFGRTQLLWECQTGKACELFPAGLYEGHPGYGPKTMIKKAQTEGPFVLEQGGDSHDERVAVEFSQQYEAHRQWKDIVDNYTARHLTFGTDKLVAISAVSRRFQNVNLESKYLAGLWRQDLAVQLLWSTARIQLKSKPTKRQADYRAPTWSWASVDGRVLTGIPDLYGKSGSIHIKIHEAKTNLVTNDPYGPINGGQLIISGRLARVLLSAVVEHREGTASYILRVCTDSGALMPQGKLGGEVELAIKDCTYESDRIALDTYEDIYLVPLTDHFDVGPHGKGRAGILFQREGESTSSFRRFGRYNYLHEDVPLFEHGFDYFDSVADESGLECYQDDVSHKNMYKITVV